MVHDALHQRELKRQLSIKNKDDPEAAISLGSSNIWRHKNPTPLVDHDDDGKGSSDSQDSFNTRLNTSTDELSSSKAPVELFVDLSLLNTGAVDLQGVVGNLLDDDKDLAASHTGAKLTYGVQNLNSTTAQFAKGFPFVKGENPLSSVFSVTLCPPHDLESVSQRTENLSFDLGFTVQKSERHNKAFVASIAKNSPAAIAGVVPTDIIKFAFAHTLTSAFRKPIPKFGSVSLLTCDFSDVLPTVAVYHAPEVESMEAGDYAIGCIDNVAETSFDDFQKLFPFDVTVPLRAYSPAYFKDDEDPILYPVTIVFERNQEDSFFFDQVTECPDTQPLSQVLTFFGRFPCMHGSEM